MLRCSLSHLRTPFSRRSASSVAFDTSLLEVLGCPLTKERLVWNPELQELLAPSTGVAYPVIAGIPHLVPISGRLLSPEEKEKLL